MYMDVMGVAIREKLFRQRIKAGGCIRIDHYAVCIVGARRQAAFPPEDRRDSDGIVWLARALPHEHRTRRSVLLPDGTRLHPRHPDAADHLARHHTRTRPPLRISGVVDLLKTAKHGPGENVYLIEFVYEDH